MNGQAYGNKETKREALLRMRKLGLSDEAVTRFERDGAVSRGCPGGCAPLDSEASAFIGKLEEHGLTVYYVLRSETGIGEIDSYLYVGGDAERWAFERSELDNGRAAAYFCVKRIPRYSAFCTVGLLRSADGIRCTGRADIF